MARPGEPGWYSDPDAPGRWRWWDGEVWTEHSVSAYPAGAREGDAGLQGGGGGLSGAGTSPESAAAAATEVVGPTAVMGPAGFAAASDVGEANVVADPTSVTGGTGATRAMPAGPGAGAGPGGPDAPGAQGGRGTAGPPPGPASPRRRAGGPNSSAGPGSTGRAAPLQEGPGASGAPPGGAGHSGRPRAMRSQPASVLLKRWLALLAVVVIVVVVLVVALQNRPPALYWQGEPLTNSQRALSGAQAAMKRVAKADEGALAAGSRCYFALPRSSAHDVEDQMWCGPVLLPWSEAAKPWFVYPLSGRLVSNGEKLTVSVEPPPSATVGLGRGEVLRQPDGASPPKGDGGLSVPAVPYQAQGWGGVLKSAPSGLTAAPVDDLVVDWGEAYRLVAYGEARWLSAGLDPRALASAVDPPGSSWATSRKDVTATRPMATLLMPPKGDVFAIAQLALSPGEDAGAVPVGANGGAAGDQAAIQLVAGTTPISFTTAGAAPGSGAKGSLTLAAVVPAGSQPLLQFTDKGLTQQISLTDGRLGPSPGILSRAGTDEALSVTGTAGGATVHVSDASLVWFAGSDGGTVPPNDDDAYLQILATASPPAESFLPASDFTLELPGGQTVTGQALPDSDREAIVVGFVVPASFSDGTVTVSAARHSFDFPVSFP